MIYIISCIICKRVSWVVKTGLNFTEVYGNLMHKNYEIGKLCKDLQKPFICVDYTELVSLALLYLSDNEYEFTGLNRPGALHKVRLVEQEDY